MASLKELAKHPDRFASGHRACPGCGGTLTARQVLLAAQGKPVVATCATGCLEVTTTIFPFTAWKVPFIHSAFENSAATASGIEAAYRALKKTGRVKTEGVKIIAFGGDGGTYDIGLQALSGAIERGHNFLYVCYNNEAYMNTGIQRSSGTCMGAHTTTSPAGSVIPGKMQPTKDLTRIIIAHDIPYAAQTTPAFWNDLTRKVEKALETEGPTFINALAPCQLGWGYAASDTIEIGRTAFETCIWPLYEAENGVVRITRMPKEKKPIEEYLKLHQRFRHLFQPQRNEEMIAAIQEFVDSKWERLRKDAGVAEEAEAQA
jgi:pyruvate ferredoxin oxidoreductase beta subunit